MEALQILVYHLLSTLVGPSLVILSHEIGACFSFQCATVVFATVEREKLIRLPWIH